MSKLNKEEVIEQFTAAFVAQNGKAPTIEQKGSWFKVEDGKSVRLAELAEMAAELANNVETASAPAAEVKPKAEAKAPAAKASTGGLTPKQLWAQKLAQGSKKPRGC